MSKYTTTTAALKATTADIRTLDAKKINLKGKNILEYIEESTPTIKYSKDTRATVTENDLWGLYIETKSDGTIVIHDDEITNPNGSRAWNTLIAKVEDNKAYVNGKLYGNILTEKIKDGYKMFTSCTNLTTFSSDLSSLTDGGSMFYGCTAITAFSSDLSNLTSGSAMFSGCSKLTTFSSDLSSLTDGGNMFYKCTNLTTFSSDLSSLTDGGSNMFAYCSNLTTFSSDLSSLTFSSSMFYSCTNLTSFSSDLSNLTYSGSMFASCSNLTSFSSDLSSLTHGSLMFSSCSKLESFSSDLASLTNGGNMFHKCTNLTSFTSNLDSLTSGSTMFSECKLNAESVMYIADTIKDITAEKQLYIDGTIPYVTLSNNVYSATRGFMSDGSYVYTYNKPKPYTTTISASYVGKLTLGINVTNDSSTIQQQLEDFAKEATFNSWSDLKQAFVNKGWTVTWQYGGTYTAITI